MKTFIKTKNIHGMFSAFWMEWALILRTKPLIVSVFVYPFIVIFGMLYMFNAEIITKVPISAVDLDQTSSSRALIQAVNGSPSISVTMRHDNLSDAKNALLKGEVFGIILLPNDFEKKVLGNLQPEVTGFSNLQYMSLGNVLHSGYSQAFGSSLLAIQAKKLSTEGVTAQLAMKELSPIAADIHPVFNPTLNYVYTLVNGVVPTILQIIIMISIAYSTVMTKYSDSGISGMLSSNHNSVLLFLVNKILPYVLIFIIALLIFDISLMVFFDLPFRGELYLQICFSLIFIICASLCSLTFTLWLPQRALIYGSISIFASPAFGFTGLFFPVFSMGTFAQVWGSILPVRWYLELRLDQTLRGGDITTAMDALTALGIISIVAYGLIALKFFMVKKAEVQNA